MPEPHPISADDVRHVAKLARLSLSEDEVERFTEQLRRVLDHAADVAALDVHELAPTAHPFGLRQRAASRRGRRPRSTATRSSPRPPRSSTTASACPGSSGRRRERRRAGPGDPGRRALGAEVVEASLAAIDAASMTPSSTPSSTSRPTRPSPPPSASTSRGGARRGSRAGSPACRVALKDNLCQRGEPTSCASKILEGWRPPYDATVVEPLWRARVPSSWARPTWTSSPWAPRPRTRRSARRATRTDLEPGPRWLLGRLGRSGRRVDGAALARLRHRWLDPPARRALRRGRASSPPTAWSRATAWSPSPARSTRSAPSPRAWLTPRALLEVICRPRPDGLHLARQMPAPEHRGPPRTTASKGSGSGSAATSLDGMRTTRSSPPCAGRPSALAAAGAEVDRASPSLSSATGSPPTTCWHRPRRRRTWPATTASATATAVDGRRRRRDEHGHEDGGLRRRGQAPDHARDLRALRRLLRRLLRPGPAGPHA